MEVKPYSIVVNLTSVHNDDSWTVVNVYGPSEGEMRDEFVQWLYNLSIDPQTN